MESYLLLLHELRVGTIVHNILAKDRSRERTVDLFCIHISQLSVQDEVVALRAQTYCRLLAQENKCKDIAILLATLEEELVRFHAV